MVEHDLHRGFLAACSAKGSVRSRWDHELCSSADQAAGGGTGTGKLEKTLEHVDYCLKQERAPHCRHTGYSCVSSSARSQRSVFPCFPLISTGERSGNGRTGGAGPGSQQPFSPSSITASTLKAKTIPSCIKEMKANSSLALPQPRLREALLQQQKGSRSLRSVCDLTQTSSRSVSKAGTGRLHWKDEFGNYRKIKKCL